MVRKSARTYSAIEAGFQAVEKKEAQMRVYFQPLTLKASASLQTDRHMSTMKHRYSDQLEWADDISTLTSIDDPIRMESLRRKHARAFSAYAADLFASQRGHGQPSHDMARLKQSIRRPTSAPAGPHKGFGGSSDSSALQAALRGALEAALGSGASKSRPSSTHSFESRMLDGYLKSNSLPATASASHSPRGMSQQAQVEASQLPEIHEEVEEVEEDEGMDGEESLLSPDAMLMYYGHTKPVQRRGTGSARDSSSRRSVSPPAGRTPRLDSSPLRGESPRRLQIPVRIRSGCLGGDRVQSPVRPQSALPLRSRPISATFRSVSPQSAKSFEQSQSRYISREKDSKSGSDLSSTSQPKIVLRARPYSSREYHPFTKMGDTGSDPTALSMNSFAPLQYDRSTTWPPGATSSQDYGAVRSSHHPGGPMPPDPLQLGGSPGGRLRGSGPSNRVLVRDPSGSSVATRKAQRPSSARPASATTVAVRHWPSSAVPTSTLTEAPLPAEGRRPDHDWLRARPAFSPDSRDMAAPHSDKALTRPPRTPASATSITSSARPLSGLLDLQQMGGGSSPREGTSPATASLLPSTSETSPSLIPSSTSAIRAPPPPPSISCILGISGRLRLLESARFASIGAASTTTLSSSYDLSNGLSTSEY